MYGVLDVAVTHGSVRGAKLTLFVLQNAVPHSGVARDVDISRCATVVTYACAYAEALNTCVHASMFSHARLAVALAGASSSASTLAPLWLPQRLPKASPCTPCGNLPPLWRPQRVPGHPLPTQRRTQVIPSPPKASPRHLRDSPTLPKAPPKHPQGSPEASSGQQFL